MLFAFRNLNSNEIKQLPAGIFSHLSKLEYLYVCSIIVRLFAVALIGEEAAIIHKRDTGPHGASFSRA